MSSAAPTPSLKSTEHPLTVWIIGCACVILVAIGARPYAGSWNDGSRLAAVESLVERGTLAIDDSIFCHPSPESIASGHAPYAADNDDLLAHGTRDKLFIAGHFYSDKPAVISLLMAGFFKAAQWLGWPGAVDRPDLFCWLLTVAASGLALATAAISMFRLGQIAGLSGGMLFAWLGSFVFGTFALAYTRHVNNHILQLAVVAAICLQLVRLAQDQAAARSSWGRLAILGGLVGLGFNLDFGSGPLLAMFVFGIVAYRCRRVTPVAVFMLAASPFVLTGLAINYHIGGVWKPMNMVPEYSTWPGCPFNPNNMTGFSRHDPFKLFVYALALLFGKHGFLVHNLPVLLALPASAIVLRKPSTNRSELLFMLGWCVATWLLYSVLSNNYGGASCSIRWFVPFLAPTYFLLALELSKDGPSRTTFFVLSGWGVLLGAIMWTQGPWTLHMVPMLWPIVGCALLTGLFFHGRGQSVRIYQTPRLGEPGRPCRAA